MSFVSYLILNVAFCLSFEARIARKDIEYNHWRSMHSCSSRLIIILSGILSFKILRLHYSHFFGYDGFKASF